MICLGGQKVVLNEFVVSVVWDLVNNSWLCLCGGEEMDVIDHFLSVSVEDEGLEEDFLRQAVADIVNDDVKVHDVVPVLVVDFQQVGGLAP